MKQDCYVTLRSDILSWAGMQQHVFTLVATSMLYSTFSVLCASCKPQNYTDQHSSLRKEDVAYYLVSLLVSGPICDYLSGCDHSAGTSSRAIINISCGGQGKLNISLVHLDKSCPISMIRGSVRILLASIYQAVR